jgi:hypothetical protein
MTQEQIIDAGIDYTMSTHPVCIGGAAFEDMIRQYNRNLPFEAGAKWAKENLIEDITQWLLEELYEEEVEPNFYYNSDVKSKRYDTVIEFIEALKKALDE